MEKNKTLKITEEEIDLNEKEYREFKEWLKWRCKDE